MKDWLAFRGVVERVINGALRAAINDHGPITEENVSSATKRVYGQLKGYRRQFLEEPEETESNGCRTPEETQEG